MSHLVHLAGQPIRASNVIRQRCAWCGALIDEIDLDRVAVMAEDPVQFVDEEGKPVLRWEGLVAVEEHGEGESLGFGAKWTVPDPDDEKIPEDSCLALPVEATR